MGKRLVFRGILFLMIFVLCNCAVKVRSTVQRPAEVNLRQYNTVAVMPFSCEHNYDFANDTATYLTQRLIGEKLYQVIDNNHTTAIVQEQNKSISELYSGEGASKIGQRLNADALIFADIQGAFDDSHVTQREEIDDQDQIFVIYRRTGTLNLKISFTVTDVATTQILAKKQLSYAKNTFITSENQEPHRIDPRQLYNQAKLYFVNEFMKVIAPYYETVDIELEKTDFHPDYDRGVAFAKQGNWRDAAPVFKNIMDEIENYPDVANDPEVRAATYFNYGISLQYLKEFDRALEYLRLANKGNPKDLYYNQIKKCEDDQWNHEELLRQGVK